MRIYPIGFGYDSEFAPNSNVPVDPKNNVLAMHRWLFEHSNLRHAGGYITDHPGAPSLEPSWHSVFEELWLMGFGFTFFDNSDVLNAPYKTHGRSEGELEAMAILNRAHFRISKFSRAVVYVDNEDADWGIFAAKVEFYKGLYSKLEKESSDQSRIRPGLYGHSWILGGVGDHKSALSEFPYLYLCEVYYATTKDKKDSRGFGTAFDPDSTINSPNGKTFQHSSNNALPWNFSNLGTLLPPAGQGNRGPKHPWRAWPVIFQFQQQNIAKLADGVQTVTVLGRPQRLSFNAGIVNWSVDYESTLVDDPAYPAVSPRLALRLRNPCSIVRLDRRDPPVDDSRQGWRRVAWYSASTNSFDAFTEPASAAANRGVPVAPGVRPCWLESNIGPVLITPRRNGFDLLLETTVVLPTSSRPAAASIADAGPTGERIPVHSPWGAISLTRDDAHLFVVAEDGSLLTSHAKPTAATWPVLEVHAEKVVHQYSQLAVSTRGVRGQDGFSVDAFFIGKDRALSTAWWNKALPWPGRNVLAIGNPEVLLPTTNLATVSPDLENVLVFGIGFDLLLYLAVWQPSGWIGPYPVGGEEELLAAHGDISAAFNSQTNRCEVVVVANELSLWLYELELKSGKWDKVGAPLTLFQSDVNQKITETVVNPFGDVALSLCGRRVVVAVFAEKGASVAKWKSSDSKERPETADIWSEWSPFPPNA